MSIDLERVKKDLELTIRSYEVNGFQRLEICRRMVRALQAINHIESSLATVKKEILEELSEKERTFRDFDKRMWIMTLDMAYQMNADLHRIHNQQQTIIEFRQENYKLKDLLKSQT